LEEAAQRPSLGYCSHYARRDFAEAADLRAARPELTGTVISDRFAIEGAAEAFRLAQDKTKAVFRVVVRP
jgi:threonine dehydrogenase-like Zn-dependent dehydrogenase